jgi:hypothetical protein
MWPIIVQKYATIYRLFISENCSTWFRWYLPPSSGAHITVSTLSERDWIRNPIQVSQDR